MFEKISWEIQEKINDLCRKISVAHNLDEEIHDELYTHMEDKLLGYLRGDEKLSEDDAFILVSEHFGNPAIIKSLYQDVEMVETHVSLSRRLGAVFAASLCVGIIYSILIILLHISNNLSKAGTTIGERPALINALRFSIFIFRTGLPIFSIVFLWRILLKWRKRTEYGNQPWFLRIKPLTFFLVIVIFLLIDIFLPFINYNNVLHLAHGPVLSSGAQKVYTFILPIKFDPINMSSKFYNIDIIFSPFYLFFFAYLWLWWCDSTPRRFRTLVIGAVTWMAYVSFIQKLQPSNILTLNYSTQQFISHFRWEYFTNSQNFVGSWIINGVLGSFALGMYVFLLLLQNGRLVLTAKIK